MTESLSACIRVNRRLKKSSVFRGGGGEVLKKRAFEHRHTPIIGRTHGMHAEPTTFGLKLASWYAELGRHALRVDKIGALERKE